MLIAPSPLSRSILSREELAADKKDAVKFESCALGKRVLYVGAFGFDCRKYIPLCSVRRVFKRLAVSKGFYEQGKTYGTISYLVVIYDDGLERVCRFRREEELDRMLDSFRRNTKIPVGKV